MSAIELTLHFLSHFGSRCWNPRARRKKLSGPRPGQRMLTWMRWSHAVKIGWQSHPVAMSACSSKLASKGKTEPGSPPKKQERPTLSRGRGGKTLAKPPCFCGLSKSCAFPGLHSQEKNPCFCGLCKLCAFPRMFMTTWLGRQDQLQGTCWPMWSLQRALWPWFLRVTWASLLKFQNDTSLSQLLTLNWPRKTTFWELNWAMPCENATNLIFSGRGEVCFLHQQEETNK